MTLPLHKKLAKHLAMNACDTAMKKMADKFHQSETGDFDIDMAIKAINMENAEDAQKQNQMSALDRMRTRTEQKKEDAEAKRKETAA